MSREMPTKLNAAPIIEAIIEIRLKASASLSDVLPGVFLMGRGKEAVNITKLAPAEIPKQIRDSEPNFKHQPLVRITLDDYQLLVGDQLLTLVCPVNPYPGGAAIKHKAVELFEEVLKLTIVEEIDRFSIKYTNFIAVSTLSEAMELLRFKATLGDKSAETFGGINFQFALNDKDHIVNLVKLAAVADVTNRPAPGINRGLVIEVDSINNFETDNIDAFKEKFPALLDSLHDTHKEAFFSLLTDQALVTLGAEYES